MIRVSRLGKREIGSETTHTDKDQLRQVEAVLAARGARRGKTYEMFDESGFTILPKLQKELLPRLASGKTNGVVIAYSDRLARNWWDAGAFFTAMDGANAEVIDATMPDTDYRSDDGRGIWGMKMVTNEMPSLAAKRRGRNLRDDLVTLGIPPRVAYGYRRNGVIGEGGIVIKTDPDRPAKALVPDEVTGPIVVRIYRLRDDGMPWTQICETLNGEGVPSANGKAWVPSSVSTLVQSETYLGVVAIGERRNESAHEPLVTRQLWQRVQKRRSVSRATGTQVAGIAGGMLYCTGCRNVLSRNAGSYGCRRHHGTGKCPQGVYVRHSRADAYVERLIVELLDSSDGIDFVASAREVEQARLAWHAATTRRERVAEQAGILDAEDFARVYRKRQDEERAAREHYEDLVAHAGELDDFPADSSAWRLLDEEHRRRVVRQVIERIDVLPPLSRAKNASVEDRFKVTFVGGMQMVGLDWPIAV